MGPADETVEGGGAPAPAAGSAWRVGAEVRDLRIIAKLGQGGMGAAFLVERVGTGARYALKVLLAGEDPAAIARFVREGEAQAAAGGHPNVLRVREAGLHAGAPYLLLDLAAGGSLADKLRDGPLPIEDAVEAVLGAARGVAHIHARGVLHRDLKPANVMFDEAGTPLLVDFGLARLEGAAALTRTGSVLGTPGYMAPEQTETSQGGIGPWTDVYGLGALLFAALTARAPFVGTGPMQVIVQVLKNPVEPPSALRPEVSPALDAVCVKAMAKAPASRHPSAAAFVAALEAARDGAPVEAPRRGRAMPVFAAALVLMALGAGGAWGWRRPSAASATSTAAGGAPPSSSSSVAPGSDVAPSSSGAAPAPASVTVADAPQTTHQASVVVRLRATGPVAGLALRVADLAGDRLVAALDEDALASGVEVPLAVGRNTLRIAAGDGAHGPPTTVWRFRIPPGLEPADAPGEVRCTKDGSLLVYHPPGRCEMGWNLDGVVDEADRAERREIARFADPGRYENETPRHTVELSRGFFLGKHEVTWDRFRRHAPAGLAPPPTAVEGHKGFTPTKDMPVYAVLWDEARRYCEHNGLRLPSEVEWEYAARGGEERRLYPFGDAYPDDARDLANTDGGADDGYPLLSPVGRFPRGASRWGCLDLAGNVYEWTADEKFAYTAEPVIDARANTDPQVRASGRPLHLTDIPEGGAEREELRFQTRGGAWDTDRSRGRSGFRNSDRFDLRDPDIGFRVACDAME